jgi:hypothetical protein
MTNGIWTENTTGLLEWQWRLKTDYGTPSHATDDVEYKDALDLYRYYF